MDFLTVLFFVLSLISSLLTGRFAGAALLRGRDCYYIACTGAAPDAVLGEYAQRLPGLPRETCRNFDEGAFEKLGI